ncbi:single-stranded-DNA-specific exonuclease RecJ [Sandaracinobacter sp. RS1-74]|uniref:single-stranded-DNA-specific exonuclease RecJ n=1 Tax=Sandaracinobacteroides sayramensis TaxID=2913411 RepID=UPI001EDB0E7B|nr:single-stranded-DNA-specific exonuclease RecJ [Sandaracinobacteroides sayramensis]MCG2841979.1 single-stranded-DNA-specific exonuclease RecJ [Sandaracinobacteroides sayramensis]
MADPVFNVSRSATARAWHWRAQPLPLGAAERLGVDELAAQILLSRGCAPADVHRTLKPALRDWLPDPSLFQDMDRVAGRLADAVERGEKIILFADYDVDGATSAAFLLRHLRALGADAAPYIPDRILEGYGPSAAALLELQRRGAQLVLLLDCGTQAFQPLEAAREAKLDLMVVDHHKASTALPPALGIVNPNRLDESPEAAVHGTLCTAGLAFLLGVALNRELRRRGRFNAAPEPNLAQWLDIVALGTVADVVPLTGLNRAFVALGLRRMAQRQSAGLSALADIARLDRAPRADDLGFHLGPRINAGGRVGQADLGVRLLASEDADEAAFLAQELDRFNQERRAIEAAVTAEALAAAEAQANSPVAVVAGVGWHPGVVGIAAARVKERLQRPALVLSLGEDGTAKGSGRSIPGVDLGAAILAAKAHGLIREGGGHAMACGVTVEAAQLDRFTRWLAEHLAEPVAAAGGERILSIDLAVTPRAITPDLAQALEACGPYGQSWPSPRVAVGPVRLVKCDPVGRTEPKTHLRFVASGPDGGRVEGIAFRALEGDLGQMLMAAGSEQLHLAGRVTADEWQGRARAQLQLDDAARAH